MSNTRYNAQTLADACAAYFDGISYEEPVQAKQMILREDGTPELDRYGHPAYRYVPVVLRNGCQAVTIRWIQPPNVAGLCLHLGISRDTWRRYTDDDGDLGAVARSALATIEEYLSGKLEDGSASRGAQHQLAHDHGWRDDADGRVDIRVTFGGGDGAAFG